MRQSTGVLTSAILCLAATAAATPEQTDGCVFLFRILEAAPHRALSLEPGTHVSLYDGESYTGCQIDFEAVASELPAEDERLLSVGPGTDLYNRGWRLDNTIAADGPGTSLFAIRNETSLCVVDEAQPAYLDDDGEIVASDTLSITIQCRPD